MKRIIFEGSNIGSYIRPQEQPPFGFKLSETRAKTNGPSLDHLAPAAGASMLIHANPLAIFAPSRRRTSRDAARFSYYKAHPEKRTLCFESRRWRRGGKYI